MDNQNETGKNRKKIIIASSIISIILLLACFFAACGEKRFCHRGKNISERILTRMDDKAEDLNLTKDQQEKYDVIRGKMKESFLSHKDTKNDLVTGLKDEIAKDNPDAGTIGNLIKEHLNEMPDFLSENIDLLVEFYNTLDRDQKKIVLDRIRKKIDKC